MAVEGIQPDLFVGLSHYCRICSIRLLSAEVKLEWVRDPLARCLHKRTPVTRHPPCVCCIKSLEGVIVASGYGILKHCSREGMRE